MSATETAEPCQGSSSPSSSSPRVLRVRALLGSCARLIEGGDLKTSEPLLAELANFLDSVLDDAKSDPGNKDLENDVFQVLSEILSFLSPTSLDQAVVDMFSFELPKAVSKFAGISSRCLEVSDSVIDCFMRSCSPRDMLSVLCEALDSPEKGINAFSYAAPILRGLSKAFLSLQRRHFEQLNVAVPIILKVLEDISSERDLNLVDIFDRAISISHAMREVAVKLESKGNEKLRALLGLYVLQIMYLVSVGIGYELATCLPLIKQLASFFSYCGLSYLGLVTGDVVDQLSSIVAGGDENESMSCFAAVKIGSCLSVIWAKISDEVALATQSDLTVLDVELRSNRMKRWQTYGLVKHVIISASLPWDLRRHALDFLLCILNEITPDCNEQIDYSLYTSTLFSTLQAIMLVIIYAPGTDLRKQSFNALKKVLADIPIFQRFEVLRALVRNSNSPSMTAILLDQVRETLREGSTQAEDNACASSYVLELVQLVLRPPEGGPPSLPEQGDAVLSALNLYRFALLVESSGKSNCGDVLSKNNLRKAYEEWLLPLRALVSGFMAQNQSCCDQPAIDTLCCLNPIELVLYRCIELTEEKLRQAT